MREITLKIMAVESLLSNLLKCTCLCFYFKSFFQVVTISHWSQLSHRENAFKCEKPLYHLNSLKSMLLVWYLSTNSTFCFFLRYSPKTPALVSETVYYKRGVSQQFTLPSFKIDFSEWKEEDVSTISLV